MSKPNCIEFCLCYKRGKWLIFLYSPNIGQTTTRLLTSGAILVGGTLVSGVLAPQGTLGNIAGGVLTSLAGNIFANDLGDLAKRVGQNEEILNDRELT